MPYVTDNLNADIDRFLHEEDESLKKLPKRDYCNEPITDDFYYEINGEIIRECCLDRFFGKRVEDYVELAKEYRCQYE